MFAYFHNHFWVILACLGCMAIAVLSLLPGYLRPHTGAPGSVEHFTAYLLVAGAFALDLRSEKAVLSVASGMMLAAGAFELLQMDIAGRSPGLAGFVASSLGVWAGIGIAGLFRNLVQRPASGQ